MSATGNMNATDNNNNNWIKTLKAGDKVLVNRINIGTVARVTPTGCVRLQEYPCLFDCTGREKTKRGNRMQIAPYSEEVHRGALMRHMAYKLSHSLRPDQLMELDFKVLEVAYSLLVKKESLDQVWQLGSIDTVNEAV